MLTHVVLITLKEGVTEEQADAALAALAALPAAIPEIRSLSCGRDAGISQTDVALAMVATFDNADDFAAYRAHPAHQAFGRDVLLPISDTRTISQFYS